MNAIARDLQTLHDTAQKWRDLAQEWKEAKDPKLGKVKGNGRSGGSAAPKQDRKAKGKKKGKEEEPCTCENCMPWEEFKVFIKAKEKAKWEAKAEENKRGKDKDMGKGKESSAVADKGQHELKRETAKETEARLSEWLTQKRWEACRRGVVRTDSPTSSLHKDVGVQCILPLKRIGFSKSKGEGKGKGNGMGDGPEPVWPIEAGEAHEI